MGDIKELEKKIRQLYEKMDPNREDWADWLARNHVFVVADYATELAKRFDADPNLSRAAAMLHDIADVKMSRFDPTHEQACLDIARKLMKESGYSEGEITLVVDDAVQWHSSHTDRWPESLEGKILSTADAMAHLKTDFYIHASWGQGKEGRKSYDENKAWTLKRVETDLNIKIFFDDIREEARPDYELLKDLYSR